MDTARIGKTSSPGRSCTDSLLCHLGYAFERIMELLMKYMNYKVCVIYLHAITVMHQPMQNSLWNRNVNSVRIPQN